MVFMQVSAMLQPVCKNEQIALFSARNERILSISMEGYLFAMRIDISNNKFELFTAAFTCILVFSMHPKFPHTLTLPYNKSVRDVFQQIVVRL